LAERLEREQRGALERDIKVLKVSRQLALEAVAGQDLLWGKPGASSYRDGTLVKEGVFFGFCVRSAHPVLTTLRSNLSGGLNPKIIQPLAGPKLRHYPARFLAAASPSL
jgi:hypothetical protein